LNVGRGERCESHLDVVRRKRAAHRAPKLGEHTDQVLSELGFDTAQSLRCARTARSNDRVDR
jgi:crotonobetainyl-CoA:carnitine CoA-transferase CaiB-like acyl-CoA transferase